MNGIRLSRGPFDCQALFTFQVCSCYLHACPCGYYGDTTRECRCTGAIIQRYLGKISGPLLAPH
jgi:magnesium chelatase family protein